MATPKSRSPKSKGHTKACENFAWHARRVHGALTYSEIVLFSTEVGILIYHPPRPGHETGLPQTLPFLWHSTALHPSHRLQCARTTLVHFQ